MPILGSNYPLSLIDAMVGLYHNPINSRPPAYPVLDGLHLRDSSSRQKIRVELVNISASVAIKNGYGIWIKKTGAPTGTFWLEYGYSANNSTPPASFTVSAVTYNSADLLDNEYTFAYFGDVVTPVADGSKQYMWVVLNGSYAVSAANYLIVAATAVDPSASYYQWNGSTWSSSSTGFAVGGTSYPTVYMQGAYAQAFYMNEAMSLATINLKLQRVGSPVGNVWLEIVPVQDYQSTVTFWEPEFNETDYDVLVEDYVTAPNREVLAISNRVSISSVPTTETTVAFNFDVSSLLALGDHYAFVLRTDATLSLVNNLKFGVDLSAPSYAEGTYSVQDSANYAAGGNYRVCFGVMGFEVYFHENERFNDQLAALGEPPADCNAMRTWLYDLICTLKGYFPSVIPEAYGGTGEASYVKGDILYAVQDDNLVRLPVGTSTSGMTLTLDDNLLPGWAKNGGQVLERLYNISGAQLDPGDVVIWSDTEVNPRGGVTYTSTPHVHDNRFCGIVVEPIINNARGFICTQGVVQARLSGSCASGDFLGLSYVARRVVSQTTNPGPMRALEAGVDGEIIYIYVDTGRADSSPAGGTIVWWTPTPPPGWLFAQGQAISRAQYQKLFSIIGTTFGTGDGISTFNIPDLRGRTVIGLDSGAGRVTNITDSLGAAGGEDKHILTVAELAQHRHFLGNAADDGTGNFGPNSPSNAFLDSLPAKNTDAQYTDYTGSNTAHNNMQPSLRGNWIIKVV